MTAEKCELVFSYLLKLFLWCEGNPDRGFRVARPCRQILRLAGGEQGMPASLSNLHMRFTVPHKSVQSCTYSSRYCDVYIFSRWHLANWPRGCQHKYIAICGVYMCLCWVQCLCLAPAWWHHAQMACKV